MTRQEKDAVALHTFLIRNFLEDDNVVEIIQNWDAAVLTDKDGVKYDFSIKHSEGDEYEITAEKRSGYEN